MTDSSGFTAVTSAMGWGGTYTHCACCGEGCRMTHYAPCVVDLHIAAGRSEH
jgi:hypothetical protein